MIPDLHQILKGRLYYLNERLGTSALHSLGLECRLEN